MKIKNYFYQTADTVNKEKKAIYIGSTLDKRDDAMSEVFFEMHEEKIKEFATTKNTALLYVAGGASHHSVINDFSHLVSIPKANIVAKSQLGYMASKTAKRVGNISYLSINANTCASAMYALHEAKNLLANGFDDVIVWGEEWVEEVELLFFRQLGVELICSDGFFVLHLCNECENPKAVIEDVSWIYSNTDRSAFEITDTGYIKAMDKFKDKPIDIIKMHGSGTAQNTAAEESAIRCMFGDIRRIEYKSKVGHSQGISAGLELCMLLDAFKGNALVNASGFGNFYGSCYVRI